jgi:hypothetical protein
MRNLHHYETSFKYLKAVRFKLKIWQLFKFVEFTLKEEKMLRIECYSCL